MPTRLRIVIGFALLVLLSSTALAQSVTPTPTGPVIVLNTPTANPPEAATTAPSETTPIFTSTARATQTALPTATATATPNEALGYSFAELGYPSIAISGGFGVGQFYLPLASSFEATREAEVTLVLNSSPLLKSISSLTINVNNQPITSVSLNGSNQTLQFTIPTNLIKAPGMLFQFRGYLRVTDDYCEDSNIPSQWVKVMGSSRIVLYGRQTDAPPSLSELPALFFSRDVRGNIAPLLFILPDAPDPITLTAAARVAAGLSSLNTDGGYKVDVTSVSSVTPAQLEASNVVLIGLAGQQQPLFRQFRTGLSNLNRQEGRYYTDDGQAVPNTDAVFETTRSPWNPDRLALVVSANTSQGLESAGLIFSNRETLLSLDGSYVFAARPIPGDNQALPPAWSDNITRLEQFGFGPRTVRGTGTLNEYYTIYRPFGARFEPGAQFVLRGSASPILRNDQSYVAVFINEVPLGAYAMTNLIDNQAITFQIPSSIERAEFGNRLNMRIEISSQIPHEQCQTIDRENAWALIEQSSEFVAAFRYPNLPNLSLYPYPFVGSSTRDAVSFVLPDAYSTHHINGVMQAAFRLGFASQRDIDITVLTESRLSADSYDNHIIFLLEQLEPDIAELFNITPEPVAEGTPTPTPLPDIFAGNRGELLNLSLYRSLNEPFGLIYTDKSPVNPDKVYLIVLSETQEGMTAALASLAQTGPLVGVSGTLAIVQEDRPPYVLFRPQDIEEFAAPPVVEAPTVTPLPQAPVSPLLSDGSASFVIIVIPIVVSLLLIFAIWLLRRGRWE
jgi:hypothetical protein